MGRAENPRKSVDSPEEDSTASVVTLAEPNSQAPMTRDFEEL